MSLTKHLDANWPAPQNIRALSTTMAQDIKQLQTEFDLPGTPEWLNQTHSNLCIEVDKTTSRDADASVTQSKSRVLAIRTADCLPIVLCNQEGSEIAALHAGWRGLLNGVVENTVSTMQSPANTLIAWVGPHICQSCFEVGAEVPEAFIKNYPFAKAAFTYKNEHKYLGNLQAIATQILKNQGINAIFHANKCTFEEKETFFSYRREKQTGRIATLIWFNPTERDTL